MIVTHTENCISTRAGVDQIQRSQNFPADFDRSLCHRKTLRKVAR